MRNGQGTVILYVNCKSAIDRSVRSVEIAAAIAEVGMGYVVQKVHMGKSQWRYNSGCLAVGNGGPKKSSSELQKLKSDVSARRATMEKHQPCLQCIKHSEAKSVYTALTERLKMTEVGMSMITRIEGSTMKVLSRQTVRTATETPREFVRWGVD